jgi:hypothetical protein
MASPFCVKVKFQVTLPQREALDSHVLWHTHNPATAVHCHDLLKARITHQPF